MTPERELELIRLAQAGDSAAEGELFERHKGRVGYLSQVLHVRGGPPKEDLEQEGCIGLIKAIRAYRPGRAVPGTYFHRYISGYIQHAIRSWERMTTMPHVDGVVDPDTFAGADVSCHLAGLSDRHRRIVEMRFGLDGQGQRTLAEIGAELGIRKQNILLALNKALAKMRGAIA